MSYFPTALNGWRSRAVLAMLLWAGSPAAVVAQTADTGAIGGTITDAAGAVVPLAEIKATNSATGESRTAVSAQNGAYAVPLLPPGSYKVEVSKNGFRTLSYPSVHVIVAETETLNAQLEVGAVTESVTVADEAEQLQTASSSLGRVTSEEMVANLPLVTRNYTQIIGLNAGVAAEVTNATALGRGSGGERSFSSAGGSQSSNNYQMDGIVANDLQNSGDFSGGVAIPNPDTIQEFKVQTSQYDATYGRNVGANVDVITKGGSNTVHGSLFEYLRNEDLNANDFFFNRAGQARGLLRENQFGGTVGGPIRKDKLFFFASYQGTRQLNGVSTACSTSFVEPPFTDNRSAAALGALFAGQKGFYQNALGGVGPAILADGSNISPQALALMNFKLPNGQYAIPSPQQINPSAPFATRGFSVYSVPCSFNEDQGMANSDYLPSARSKFAFRFFVADSNETETFPPANIGGPTAPGWPILVPNKFYNASVGHTFIITPRLLNQFEAGYHRTYVNTNQSEPLKYSAIGITAPSYDDGVPAINVNGALSLGGNGQSLVDTQNTYVLQDGASWTWGRHVMRFGGGIVRTQNNIEGFHYIGGLIFLSFPDLLLGLNATQSGTAAVGVPVGNVYLSIDLAGLFDRAFRTWDGNLYFQDDIKVSRRLTLNLGLRYERLGDISDALGRNGNFNYNLAEGTPPASGTLAGFVVPSNYSGPLPTGVTKLSNNLGYNGTGQNTWNPRVGFAYQLPGTNRLVLRGGYGFYHDRTTGQPFFQLLTVPPFSVLNQLTATQNGAATLANPFPAAISVPIFPPYSPTTSQSPTIIDPDYRSPTLQHYSMGLQTKLIRDLVLDVTYNGARGTHLLEVRSINEAQLASTSNPIRGVTTNTVANIPLRVPYQGFTASSMQDIGANGESWYNALDVSLEKRLSHGLQFLASYTFARTLATDTGSVSGSNGGTATGDQNSRSQRYGPDSFIRDQRFVVSAFYALPGPANSKSLAGQVLGGWRLAGVVTVQAGQRLTLTTSTATNVFGVTTDRVQLALGCTYPDLATSGSIQSRLTGYFNKTCVTTAPVIGADAKGTTFGNAGVGIVRGPGQANADLSLIKQFGVPRWDRGRFEFRTEFFNAFNHPQFANPSVSFSSASFGQILTTNVNPRVIQFALKLTF
ncbi:MAG TPA: carboxypeptidase-like regulatory domain-containing protein [Bryobacteraceae bacterium]|nr:carboxypeptidase-like regulatory domain-containing protein [Bryobacteraceae bacterium]